MSKSKPTKSDDARRGETYAAIAVAVVGLPLLWALGNAVFDGQQRAEESPLRALLGDSRFDDLNEGGGGFPHYLGRERLAPDFTVEDRSGREWRLSEQRGKVILMNFWSWDCEPCREEMPSLEILAELAERWDDVEVVAISADPDWTKPDRIIPPRAKLTHLIDPDKSVTEGMFGTVLYPETWIIDRDGVVRMRYDGAFDWSSPIVLDVIESYR